MCKKIISTILFFLIFFNVSAQKKQQSYEYQRAYEALTERGDEKEAVEYFKKDLTNNPKNGYSWYWMAVLYYSHDQYGDALTSANSALDNIPSSDHAFVSFANSLLCDIYLHLEDTIKALERINKAVKLDKKSESFKNKRGLLYLSMGDFAKSKKDFNAVLKMNEANSVAYVGLGRLDLYEGRQEEALVKFTKAINLDAKYQAAYSWRALVYEYQKKYGEALTDHIAALYLGYSDFDYRGLRNISTFMFSETISRLQSVATQDNSTALWYHIIGKLNADNNQYEAAVEAYAKAGEIADRDFFLSKVAECYIQLGNYRCALKHINDAIAENPNKSSYFVTLATIHDLMGQYENALDDFEKALNTTDEESKFYTYHRRGWIKMHNNDIKGAMNDFIKSIALEKDYSYNYLCRGMIWRELGLDAEAKKDFEMVIDLESDSNYYSARPYAHYYLGQREDAKKSMDVMLRNGGSYYDAACLYSLISESETALVYLEKALQGGYRTFAHIERDHDLDNIRKTTRFRKLLEKYKSLPIVGNCGEDVAYVDTVVYIPFTKNGNVCQVKCTINDLPLNFIFDTGAGDVCLSSSEASMMLKQGYLVSGDFRGSSRFKTADGSISEGAKVNLRNVELGGIKISDVSATIVNNNNAPALLGQSVLSRFGAVEIDYDKKQIKVTGKIPCSVIANGKDLFSPEALDGAKSLLNLLRSAQENPKRTSKYQTTRDALAYDCKDAIMELMFYKKNYSQDNGLESKNSKIRSVSILYRAALNLIKDYINGSVDDLDFSDIINKLSVIVN